MSPWKQQLSNVGMGIVAGVLALQPVYLYRTDRALLLMVYVPLLVVAVACPLVSGR